MKVLGIETSCDECSASIVEDGSRILSNVVATQIPFHQAYNGVVPEIASRKHTEWILPVAREAMQKAGIGPEAVDGVAASSRPGLLGSLLVGLTFAKAFAWSRSLPFIAVDHILAHLYAPRLVQGKADGVSPDGCLAADVPADYPFLGLLVSGGHTIICRVDDFDRVFILGTTIDDAVGEAFDKVSKHYGFGYPGGVHIDRLAQTGDSGAFRFPLPNLYKGEENEHRYDVSYSGLKTAVINQLEQFRAGGQGAKPEDIAASFQKTAVDILLRSLFRAVEDTGLKTVVAGGGVAANSYLRSQLASNKGINCVFPPPELCGDNAAMIAGLGCQYLARGETSPMNTAASARVQGFKRRYPQAGKKA